MTSKKKFNLFKPIKKFWHFLWYDDSLLSYLVNFAVAFLFIKYIFFPGIGFALNNDYPVVAIVSGSMEHKIVNNVICDKKVMDVESLTLDYDSWWKMCGDYYENNYNMSKEEFKQFDYTNGLNIGDVMILYGKEPQNIEIGEVLVFIPEDREFFNTKGPVIHRVVSINETDGHYVFATKGDHNSASFENFERNIPEEDVIAVATVRIPYVGYAKLALTNGLSWVQQQFAIARG